MYKLVAFSHLWLENVTMNFMTKELEINKRTAVDWASFHREVVIYAAERNVDQLGGPDMVVKIDESKFGHHKYHRGHRVEGQWVFEGVERGTGRCFLVPVEERSTEVLLRLIKKYIKPNTTIISDSWKAYNCLSEEGFQHLTVNHSIQFKNPETGAHTNTIEGLWRHVKASLPQYNRKKNFFHGYLAKFLFKRKCRSNSIDVLPNFSK